MPTAMFHNTPINCNICIKNTRNCNFMIDSKGFYKDGFNPVDPEKNISNPEYNGAWVTKFCTMMEVDNFILYFPYVLLLMPLVMVALEKVFIK